MTGKKTLDDSQYFAKWAQIEREISTDDASDYCVRWGEAREDFFSDFGARNVDSQSKQRLEGLKGTYAGERVFILGNGPSLLSTPLHLLENEFTFAVNRFYLMNEALGWKPTFYTALDWRVVPDNALEINALTGSTFFFDERFRGILREGPDVYFYAHGNYGREPNSSFSHDIERGVAGAGSVVGTAIQIAAYLGFDQIYLLGCDLGYRVLESVSQEGEDVFGNGVKVQLTSTQDDDPNHFDPKYFGKGKRWHDPNVKRMIEGHASCLDGVTQAGKQIFNATVGGELEVYPRVDIWKVLGNSPPRAFSRDSSASIDESEILYDYFTSKEDEPGFMIDVGAHHGHCSKPFADSGWNVYCFEPDEKNRRYLERNLGKMANVSIDTRAVSDEKDSEAPFFRSEQSSGISGLLEFHDTHRNVDRVSVTTLSDVFWEEERPVRFLKIDVEGFDLNVLKGVPWDRMLPEVVLCEFEDAKTTLLGHTYNDMADYLVSHGYAVYLSEWHPVLRYGVKHDWRGLKRYPCRTSGSDAWGNLLAFRDDPGMERLEELVSERVKTRASKIDDRGESGTSKKPERARAASTVSPSTSTGKKSGFVHPVADPVAMLTGFAGWVKRICKRFPVAALIAVGVLVASVVGALLGDGNIRILFASMFLLTGLAFVALMMFGYLISRIRRLASTGASVSSLDVVRHDITSLKQQLASFRASAWSLDDAKRDIADLKQQLVSPLASASSLDNARQDIASLERQLETVSQACVDLKGEFASQLDALQMRVSDVEKQSSRLMDADEATRLQLSRLYQARPEVTEGEPALEYQLFSRQLSDGDLEVLLREWVPKLELTVDRRELVYIADRVCSLESVCLGRIATTIENAVLRVLVATSIREEQPEILEIGTLFGLGAITLFDALSGKSNRVRLTLIDPLSGYYDLHDVDHLTGESITKATLERNLELCHVPASSYRILQGKSEDPAIIAEACSRTYNLLLIDGDHSREGVRRDFENYISCVRSGGYILFDDYGAPEWDQITQYVDEVVRESVDVEFVASGFRTALFKKL